MEVRINAFTFLLKRSGRNWYAVCRRGSEVYGHVQYPHGQTVQLRSRKALIEYIKYAYGMTAK